MSLPDIVLAARSGFALASSSLTVRRALTRARDELAAGSRRLPMVEVTEDYRFAAAKAAR